MKIRMLFATVAVAQLTTTNVTAEMSNTPLKYVTRSYADHSCTAPVQKQAFPFVLLLSIFGKPIIEGAIKGVAGLLKKAGDDKTIVLGAEQLTNFYSVSLPNSSNTKKVSVTSNFTCLTLIYARPHVGEVMSAELESFQKQYGLLTDDVKKILKRDLTVKGVPYKWVSPDLKIFLQFGVTHSSDGTAYRLVPIRALGNGSLNPKFKRGADRDLVITTTFIGPSEKDDKPTFLLRNLNLKDVPYTAFNKDLSNEILNWAPIPAVPSEVAARIKSHATRLGDHLSQKKEIAAARTIIQDPKSTEKQKEAAQKKKIAAEASEIRLLLLIDHESNILDKTLPMIARMEVRETQDGIKFLKNFGELLDKSAADLAGKAVAAIDPKQRATRAADRAQKDDDLRSAAITTVSEYEAGQADSKKSAAEKRVLQIKASAACRKLRAAGFEDVSCNAF